MGQLTFNPARSCGLSESGWIQLTLDYSLISIWFGTGVHVVARVPSATHDPPPTNVVIPIYNGEKDWIKKCVCNTFKRSYIIITSKKNLKPSIFLFYVPKSPCGHNLHGCNAIGMINWTISNAITSSDDFATSNADKYNTFTFTWLKD